MTCQKDGSCVCIQRPDDKEKVSAVRRSTYGIGNRKFWSECGGDHWKGITLYKKILDNTVLLDTVWKRGSCKAYFKERCLNFKQHWLEKNADKENLHYSSRLIQMWATLLKIF